MATTPTFAVGSNRAAFCLGELESEMRPPHLNGEPISCGYP
jgi:hypothetical protein